MSEQKPPNILFIMDDQHRFDYLGCAGADWVRTPNIDAIAASGVRFTHCHTNAPVCAPARIALACGMQPWRVGAINNNAFLPANTPTYYQHLRDHGYRVGGVGKFDLAKPDIYNGRRGDRPCNYMYGFTHPVDIEGKMHGGNHDTPQGPYGYFLQGRGEFKAFRQDYKRRAEGGWHIGVAEDSVLPTEANVEAFTGDHAVNWIENHTDDFPWHLFVSFVGPHDPFDPPTEYADRYRNAAMPDAIPFTDEGKPAWARQRSKRFKHDQVLETRRQYCALIELIDEQIGRILAALDATGQRDNTYIIFSSDHGEMLGDHGMYTKQTPYDSALRVPLIVSGPGIKGGLTSDALVELIDINPTISELAGLPAQLNLDAKSFGSILRGEVNTHREHVMSKVNHFQLLRNEQYKLIHSENDSPELYDMIDDPHEQRNLINEKRDVAQQMSRQLRARFIEGRWHR